MSISAGTSVTQSDFESESFADVPNVAMEFDSTERRFVESKSKLKPLLEGQVLVRVLCCTLCGSDLHTVSGRRSGHNRGVLGHEIVGEVVGWCGEFTPMDYHGAPLQIGQRITWAMSVGCEHCFYCDNDLNQKCDSLFKYGHEANDGHPTGGLSEHCVLVAGTPIFPVPDALSNEVVAPVNCATATVSAALRLVNQTHQIKGSTVLVVGAGMLGLTAAAQLSEAGATRVVVADPNADRAKLAQSFGATDAIVTETAEERHLKLRELTDGRGVDVAIDFAGMTTAVEACLQSVRMGGCVMLVGSVFPSDPVPLYPEQAVRRMLTIRGLHNYLPRDLDDGLRFLERNHHRFPFESLVGRSFPLSEVDQAFEYAMQERPVRVAVYPSSTD
ncbi:zinc-binding dehydrogenase [Rhodopirellula bahusiensis]|uniref:alcohol dehydrogenase n=1 Tax=Rhodopirellula bahusiensis TaxID=2014065 RepID=A0A2G1W9P0_9BACT|nr:zinc-binding dehydrogenase [Rhodopirellula bahusiensis]PHQ35743.1 alcohol dehydrogenase [Rhodopirellula bahusiensis]